MDRMEHQHFPDHRGWMVCVTPNGPPEEPWYLGHGVREMRPHRVVMAEAQTEAEALDELRRQIDAIENAASEAPAAANAADGSHRRRSEN
jgi:hypothetical protein